MAVYDLSVRYAGRTIENGRIPVSELAPSLLAISETFQEIQKITNPNEQPLSLDIKANREGSFIVDLILASGSDNLLQKTISLLNGDESTAIVNLAGYYAILNGVVKFTKFAYKKIFKKKEPVGENETKITFEDNTSITVNNQVLNVFLNVDARESIKKATQPLNNGVDKIEFSTSDGKNNFDFYKEDYDAFQSVPKLEEKELNETVEEKFLFLQNVAFENGKWKVSDGAASFFVTIEDEQFIKDVTENKVQFGSTDRMKVRIKTIQRQDADGHLKSDYFIEKVIEIIKGDRQTELF